MRRVWYLLTAACYSVVRMRSSECRELGAGEGGPGDGACFRHADRRNVNTGICLDKR